MDYETRVIQGFLHWRRPDGSWEPFSKSLLQARIDVLEARLAEVQDQLDLYRELYEDASRMLEEEADK